MSKASDNRGLYLRNLIDAYMVTVPAPKGSNYSRDIAMQKMGEGILGDIARNNNSSLDITDLDGIGFASFHSLGATRDCQLPTCADNVGRLIFVVNEDGGFSVNVKPENRGGGDIDYINSFQADVPITEKWGWWGFFATEGGWVGFTDGWSTIIYQERATDYAVASAISGQWYDITGVSVALSLGDWLVTGHCDAISAVDASVLIGATGGIGTVSGNNYPNLAAHYCSSIWHTANFVLTSGGLILPEVPITVAGAITLYLKMMGASGATPLTSLTALATTNNPMFVRARRRA